MASQWYYTEHGQQHGPVSSGQLRQLAATGQLQAGDLVWQEGADKWFPASRVKGLFPAAGPPPAPVARAATTDPLGFLEPGNRAAVRVGPPVAQKIIISGPRKSALVAFLLAFFFGPLGMFYTTVSGALIMLVVSVFLAIFTLGFSLLLTWPMCCIWAAVAAGNSR